ncbi:MAG: hypothetical protein ACRED1_02555 [Limisphaerales bacterium]
MRHSEEIYSRFHSEMRAIGAMPRIVPEDADPPVACIGEAWAELERATDPAAFEAAAQKLRDTIAFVHKLTKSKAELWARYESAYGSLQKGITDALERDKKKLCQTQ